MMVNPGLKNLYKGLDPYYRDRLKSANRMFDWLEPFVDWVLKIFRRKS